MTTRHRPAMGALLFFAVCLTLSVYFTFAAVQGDFGILQRAEIDAEGHALRAELLLLQDDVARLENLTRRMSDDYLDIDLLDEQARDVLGLTRGDEIVIR